MPRNPVSKLIRALLFLQTVLLPRGTGNLQVIVEPLLHLKEAIAARELSIKTRCMEVSMKDLILGRFIKQDLSHNSVQQVRLLPKQMEEEELFSS